VALQEKMITYLKHFAVTGNPNAWKAPVWGEWSDTPGALNCMSFDGTFTEAVVNMINWTLP
jgi:hypothetical protein